MNTYVVNHFAYLDGKTYFHDNTINGANNMRNNMVRVGDNQISTIYSNVFNLAGNTDDESDRLIEVRPGATVNIYKNTFITQNQPGIYISTGVTGSVHNNTMVSTNDGNMVCMWMVAV